MVLMSVLAVDEPPCPTLTSIHVYCVSVGYYFIGFYAFKSVFFATIYNSM